METNLIGELKIMKELNIKPNMSSLIREYGCDRHTIKKYYENDGIPLRKKSSRSSKWDPYFNEIEALMNKKHVTKRSVYMYLKNKYGDALPGTYDGFKAYTLHKGMTLRNHTKPHVLYEVDPGKQLQVDWKENLLIHLRDGTEILFNVFSATLGYSREHVFIYSSSKTTEDFIRCLIESFRRFGGITEHVLTDNMSAVVSIKNHDKTIHSKIRQLFKDIGCELKLCKPRTPQTKGKDENSNKFVKWIFPYDYELNSEDELIQVVEETICKQCNLQNNSGTGMPPIALFKKEKEYLKPLPAKVLLESYIEEHHRSKVPPTLLIQYGSNKYSVPSAYIGKYVDIYPIGDSIYVYFNKKLIAKHTISQNKINYNKSHYEESLKKNIKNKEVDIEEMAMNNLNRLQRLGVRKDNRK